MNTLKGPFRVCSGSSEWGNALRERLRSPLGGEVTLNVNINLLNDNMFRIYKFPNEMEKK